MTLGFEVPKKHQRRRTSDLFLRLGRWVGDGTHEKAHAPQSPSTSHSDTVTARPRCAPLRQVGATLWAFPAHPLRLHHVHLLLGDVDLYSGAAKLADGDEGAGRFEYVGAGLGDALNRSFHAETRASGALGFRGRQ